MTAHQLLGRLSGLQRMLVELTESLPEPACYQSPHPELAPVAWYLGRAVYLETYWLREVVQGDDDITARVRALFTPGAMPAEQQWQSLPPKDHLLNWALELQEENLTLLANPSMLPAHILMQEERLLLLIYAALGEIYEQMIRVVTEQQLGQQPHYRVTAPLRGVTPVADAVGISQGHYRIGARNDPASADNEQPAQAVELSSYQIDRVPVSNTFYLGFMEAGGYQQHSIWSPEG